MDQIPQNYIQNCDIQSKVYCKAFNELILEDPRKLNDRDLSYLGLFLCKCVEEEINSSIVQLMREVKGIEMPEHYCRKQENKTVKVITHNLESKGLKNKYADLNCSYNSTDGALKMISLGDSYYAMTNMLSTQEGIIMVNKYGFLNESAFHDTWREILKHRNNIAHAGHITDRKTMEKCYEACKVFFEKYMPELAKIKESLGWKPDQRYWENLIVTNENPPVEEKADLTKRITQYKPRRNDNTIIYDNYYHSNFDSFNSLRKTNLYMTTQSYISELETDDDVFFNGELAHSFKHNGKTGLKYSTGTIILKAEYDHIFASSEKAEYILAIKDGKSGFIDKRTLQFSDQLLKVRVPNCFLYKTEGCNAYGIVNLKGEILAPPIIDSFDDQLKSSGVICESGGYYGYLTRKGVWIDAEFDAIIGRGISRPVVFVLDGEEGIIDENSLKFFPTGSTGQKAIH